MGGGGCFLLSISGLSQAKVIIKKCLLSLYFLMKLSFLLELVLIVFVMVSARNHSELYALMSTDEDIAFWKLQTNSTH